MFVLMSGVESRLVQLVTVFVQNGIYNPAIVESIKESSKASSKDSCLMKNELFKSLHETVQCHKTSKIFKDKHFRRTYCYTNKGKFVYTSCMIQSQLNSS